MLSFMSSNCSNYSKDSPYLYTDRNVLPRVEVKNFFQSEHTPLAKAQPARLPALVQRVTLALSILLPLPLKHLKQHSGTLPFLLRSKVVAINKILVLVNSSL